MGKRLAPKATQRNLVRRRLKEAARQLRVAGGHDVIVTARQGALTATLGELRNGLAVAVSKAGLRDEGRGE